MPGYGTTADNGGPCIGSKGDGKSSMSGLKKTLACIIGIMTSIQLLTWNCIPQYSKQINTAGQFFNLLAFSAHLYIDIIIHRFNRIIDILSLVSCSCTDRQSQELSNVNLYICAHSIFYLF